MLCKVVEVYDGDTVTLCFKFRGKYFKKRCRLYGINAPEIRSKNIQEKEKGRNSKNYVYSILQDKIVIFKCKGYDKYGRLLGDIFLDGKNINDDILEKGFAVKYVI
jgi:micrococcal nuclease